MQILINNVIVFDDMTYGQCEVSISFINNITANDTIQIIASPPGYDPINSVITITPEVLNSIQSGGDGLKMEELITPEPVPTDYSTIIIAVAVAAVVIIGIIITIIICNKKKTKIY